MARPIFLHACGQMMNSISELDFEKRLLIDRSSHLRSQISYVSLYRLIMPHPEMYRVYSVSRREVEILSLRTQYRYLYGVSTESTKAVTNTSRYLLSTVTISLTSTVPVRTYIRVLSNLTGRTDVPVLLLYEQPPAYGRTYRVQVRTNGRSDRSFR